MKNLLVLFLLLTVAPLFAEKIGYVDMKKVWDNVDEIKKEKVKIESMAEKSKKTLEAKKAELEIMAKKMQGEMTMATEEAKKAMYEEYQKKMFEVQQLAQEYQKKIQQKDVSVQASFVDKIKLIVAKISKKKGYTVVLAKENLLFTSGANDITLDVIKAYNSK